ncbi:hypothetical protein ACFSQT_11760 [Mesorhizobium calcicola]|uniref:GIY-YIG domain-containing protein n=1 Tax=Mesorhizobium calcicola TaxID=1300310 RepID=A0ABW4WCY5_9HYPH
MNWIPEYKPTDFGGPVESMQNRAGKALYKNVTLVWSKPQLLELDEEKIKPFFEDDRPLLYAIIRNHHKMMRKNLIAYIGLSTNPKARFQNHPTAKELAAKRGATSLSYAYLDTGRSSSRIDTIKGSLEQIEHILIWALWSQHDLRNDRKVFTLPGMGTKGADAWRIINDGYRFSGTMPREIVYPWMLTRLGKDRSKKKLQT